MIRLSLHIIYKESHRQVHRDQFYIFMLDSFDYRVSRNGNIWSRMKCFKSQLHETWMLVRIVFVVLTSFQLRKINVHGLETAKKYCFKNFNHIRMHMPTPKESHKFARLHLGKLDGHILFLLIRNLHIILTMI